MLLASDDRTINQPSWQWLIFGFDFGSELVLALQHSTARPAIYVRSFVVRPRSVSFVATVVFELGAARRPMGRGRSNKAKFIVFGSATVALRHSTYANCWITTPGHAMAGRPVKRSTGIMEMPRLSPSTRQRCDDISDASGHGTHSDVGRFEFVIKFVVSHPLRLRRGGPKATHRTVNESKRQSTWRFTAPPRVVEMRGHCRILWFTAESRWLIHFLSISHPNVCFEETAVVTIVGFTSMSHNRLLMHAFVIYFMRCDIKHRNKSNECLFNSAHQISSFVCETSRDNKKQFPSTNRYVSPLPHRGTCLRLGSIAFETFRVIYSVIELQ